MNIVFCINFKYLTKAGILITSILSNDRQSFFNFYLFSADISQKDLEILKKLKEKFSNFSINLINIDTSSFKNLPLNLSHISLEAYFRWFIPQFLPKEEKALYMDVDMIVTGKINQLYAIDLNDFYVAAAPELYADQINYKKNIGLKKEDLYVNSGVLLMNLKLWRQENLTQKLLKKSIEMGAKATYMDQDILNVVCKNRIKEISPKYNYTMAWIKANTIKMKNVFIIHYTGAKKPWGYKKVRRGNIWKKYAKIFSKITGIKKLYPSLWVKIVSKYQFKKIKEGD